MSEVKRHYIADESLGGIEREYVEVESKANVGDYVVVSETFDLDEEFYDIGHIGKVLEKTDFDDDILVDFNGYNNDFVYDGGHWWVGKDSESLYKTLSPTGIIRHNGQRYEMVDRKAEVGEKVIYLGGTYGGGLTVGRIYDITEVRTDVLEEGSYQAVLTDDRSNTRSFWETKYYRVLVPLDDAPQSPQSPDDIIANLVARLAKAERKITELSEQVDHNTDNIRTWAEDYSEHKANMSDKVEMLTDDIAMLDERTQPLTTEGVSKLSEELAQVVTEAIDVDKPVFDASNIRTFNLSDLNGKTLKIRTSTDWDGNVRITTTVGFDENEDKIYILENKTEVFE